MTATQGSPFGAYPEKLPDDLSVTLPAAGVLTEFCKRWKIRELALFGEHLGIGADVASPIDVLVRFAGSSPWTLGQITRLEELMRGTFGRPCHLIEGSTVDGNMLLRQRSQRNARTLYRAW